MANKKPGIAESPDPSDALLGTVFQYIHSDIINDSFVVAQLNAAPEVAAPGLRLLGKEDRLSVIEYHDEGRHSEKLPTTTIDVYSVAFGREIPHRVVHQFLP